MPGKETFLFYVSYHTVCVYHGNFLIFSLWSSPFFLTPTLWQMVPHKSCTQISSQGNASLLLKRGTNVRWIWDEFALWIKFTGPRWLLPRVYQETTILLYFISYNSERIFHILAQEECRVEGKMCCRARLAIEHMDKLWVRRGLAVQTRPERELDEFEWDW